jgi:hypothetical protein
MEGGKAGGTDNKEEDVYSLAAGENRDVDAALTSALLAS